MCFLVGLVFFFNSMNLDTELVVAILGQDSPCESSMFFDFPPYYSVPSLLNLQVGSILFHPFAQIARHCFSLVASLIQSNSTMASSGMRRTHSDAFQDRAPPVLEPKIDLLLHVALSPVQFQMLLDQRSILPDPYSSRFGLRADPIKAMERARYFMCWNPPYDVSPPQTSIKKFMICSFTPIGVLSLLQAGLLEPGDGSDASRSGYFRYKGPLYHELRGTTDQGTSILYYEFKNQYHEVI